MGSFVHTLLAERARSAASSLFVKGQAGEAMPVPCERASELASARNELINLLLGDLLIGRRMDGSLIGRVWICIFCRCD